MLIYFKKYIALIAAIGIVVPGIVSIVYSALTNTMLESEIWGIAVLVGLFAASVLISFNLLERRAEKQVEKLISLYNADCDPEAMVSKGAKLAKALTFPITEEGAWFMGYYAQALLDMGDREGAARIEQGLRQSVIAAKAPLAKVRILVNLVQLAEKLGTLQDSLDLIDEGLEIIAGNDDPAAVQRQNFLLSQKKIIEARMSRDANVLIGIDDAIKSNSFYPMRVRVEYAFNGAQVASKMGNTLMEQMNLEFVVNNGNKLALVPRAQAALAQLRNVG